MILSKMEGFSQPDPAKEQYKTDSEIAATILWNAFMQGDIKDKVVADLGAGTGVLGLGALALGAKFVFLVELDETALEIARKKCPDTALIEELAAEIEQRSNRK